MSLPTILDTNVVVRAIVDDHAEQSPRARALLDETADLVVTPAMLCELVWVLRRAYKHPRGDVEATLRALVGSDTVIIDPVVTAAGLAAYGAGADFADGVILEQGRRLGGERMATFDRRAAARLRDVQLLA